MNRRSGIAVARFALLVIAAGPAARAADAPHDPASLPLACSECHLPHNAPGSQLTADAANANLCLSCHQTRTNPTVLNWQSADQASPGVSGSSHRWDAPASSLQRGAQPPTGAALSAGLANGTTLQCSTCHNQHSQANAPFDPAAPAAPGTAGRHFLRTANNIGQMCVDCHAPWNQASAATGAYITAGTATFTNGSAAVSGSGTTWAGNVQPGWRVKPLAAPASAWAVVRTVASNTSLTLAAPYTGTTVAAAPYVAARTLSHPVAIALAAGDFTVATPREVGGAPQVAGFMGTATGGTTATLVDTTKNFTGAAGLRVRFTSGPNRNTVATITGVTGTTTLNFAAIASAVTAGTRYQVDVDGNVSNNVPLVSGSAVAFTSGAVACQSCHGVHFADSSATTYDDRPPAPAGGGDGRLLRRSAAETCDACHPSTLMHSSANVGTKHGTWGTTFTCLTCHQPHQTANVNLVRPIIPTPNNGNRDVDLRAIDGGVEAYGLANSVTPGSGPCETCHTNTRNGSELTGATSAFTAGNTSATLSSTTGIAASWELKRTADGPLAWTRIATVVNGTTVTLAAGGYRGTSGGGAWQAANPRFRNTGSGRGAAGTEHYVTSCLGCHPHKAAFKGAGEPTTGGSSCDGCHTDLTARMSLASGGTTLGGRPIVSRHQLTSFLPDDSGGPTWASPLNAVTPANRSCVNMCHGDHPHDLTSPLTPTHENNAYLDATSAASRATSTGGMAQTRTSATRARTDFDSAAANGGMCLSCHRYPVDSSVPVQHPAIDKTAYTGSAHNYASNTVGATTYPWTYTQHDASTFDRNCTKCHAERADGRPDDGTIPFEAVHYSSNPSLLAGNVQPAAAGNVVAELICYNCHGNGTNGQDLSGKNLYDEVTSAFGHPVNSDSRHDTIAEGNNPAANDGKFSGANRHVSCMDCHEPHRAQPVGSGATAGSITAYTAGTDYTTGTASVIRNGTAVTGTGTSWTSAMVGQGFQFNPDPGVWYTITAVASATSLTISPLSGTARSGVAYTIRGANPDTLTDSTKAWTKHQFKGWTLKLVSGTQAGRSSAIYGSPGAATTQLFVKFPSAPAVGDRYVIVPSGLRVAPGGMPPGSPAMAGAWGAQPTFGAPPAPPNWNDSGGCGAAGTANSCEVITATYAGGTTFAKTTASPPAEAYVCLKCHSSFAYGTTLANFPNAPSGQPNVPDGTGQAWSDTAGVAMRQSDLAGDANPGNAGHHAIFARGRNQPMVSSAATASVRNPNWPTFTADQVNASGTTVTLNTGTWPITLLPGWFIYVGSSAPANPSAGWYEVTAVTSDTVLTIDRACAAPSTCSANTSYLLTAGLGNSFVPPWGPWSVLECSDCHRSSTLSDPLGPHGSTTKWLLRGADAQTFLGGFTSTIKSFTVTTTPTDTNNICVNCHRRDVYGDFTFFPTPGTPVAGATYTFSRQNHPPDSGAADSLNYRSRWGIACMNCHGGARQGGIHGENLGVGNNGTTALSHSGKRLLAGSAWYAVTRSSAATAGQCWTKGATDAVDSCGHSHSGVSFQSGTANYDYESTAGSSPVVR